MKLSLCFSALIFLLCAFEAFAWWGGSSRRESSSRSTGRHKISSNGGGKAVKTTQKTERKKGGWWGSRNSDKNSPKKPGPKPKQLPLNPKPKPKTKGWFFSGKSSERSKPKVARNPKNGNPSEKLKPKVVDPKPKKASTNKFNNPNYIPSKPKDIKDPNDMKTVIKSFETVGGKPNLKVYNANSNPKIKDPTIGYGFSMKRGNAKKIFQKVLPGVDFDKVKSGKQSITDKQAGKLFEHDIKEHVNRAKDKVGADTYNKLPDNVKSAVVTAVYRGDLGPKTAGHIKKGEWDKVSTEYLDHQEYKNAKGNKMEGVVQRMNWVADQFDTMRDSTDSKKKKKN